MLFYRSTGNLRKGANEEDDKAMVKMVKGATKQAIAIPGNSNHQNGRAFDVGGLTDAEQVRALLWCHVEFSDSTQVTKILPERNGCVHFEFKL